MSLDAIQERFIDEIKLRGYDDKFIDKNEEREILQIAIHQGIGIDAGRAALVQVCANLVYLLESDLMKLIKEQFDAVGSAGIDQSTFDGVLAKLRTIVQGKQSDRELKQLIVHAIDDGGLKVKSGWPFNWYRAVKRDLASN